MHYLEDGSLFEGIMWRSGFFLNTKYVISVITY